MYDEGQKAPAYDNTTDFYKESDYDMYSDDHSECGTEHIHIGPLVAEVCHHDEGMHVVIFEPNSGEKIAETDVSDHSIEDHMSSIAEGMDNIHKAYADSSDLNKSDKPFHGYSEKKHSKTGGLNDSYREKVNREEGSNLKRPVTGDVKPGSKAANRRKSFCARMSGVKGKTSEDGKLTPKGAALKRWKCSKSEDMNKSEQLKQFMNKVENKKKLEHYSTNQGLKSIDPQFKGTGVDARTKGRDSEHPHSFYYTAGATPESHVADNARSKYTVEIPEEASIYDVSSDPQGFAKQIREKNHGAFNMDEMHSAIKANGHHGFTASNHPVEEMRGVVGLYHAQDVTNEEPVNKSEGKKKYVTVPQDWASKKMDSKTKKFTNPVRDAGKNKPTHMNDLHSLKSAGHIQGWNEHDHPKKSWGSETYEVGHDGSLKYVHAQHDSSD